MKKILKISATVVGLISVFGLGITFEKRKHLTRTLYCGSIRIDQSESDEPPRLFLELEVPLESFRNLETASFKVINKNYIYANKTRPIVEKSKLKEDRNEN